MSFRTFVTGGSSRIRLPSLPVLLLLLLSSLFVNCVSVVKCNDEEYYSSVAGLENLLKTEQILAADLKDYVKMIKQQIIVLEKELLKIDLEHELASKDTESYLSNPVNTYKLINRLHNNWDKYEDQISEAFDFIQLLHKRKNDLGFPSEDDFEESAMALVRLQKTYNLEVSQVASGVLNGVKYGTDMSWSDCLMLGEQLIKLKALNQTKPWMEESVRRLNFDSLNENKVTLEFMELLAENLLKIGDINSALAVIQLVLNTAPLRKGNMAKIIENTETETEAELDDGEYHATEEFKLYEKVCREEVRQSPSEQRNLRCRYHSGDCAFCQLVPIKVEELNLDPLVMIFHDMLTEKKIETIIDLALPKMERSTVRSPNGDGSSKKRNYRISKNAWLPYDTHPYMLKMLKDIHDVTGLDMSYSEELQVANYGLGGHYEPHFDFFLTHIPEEQGNRISTSIFYVNAKLFRKVNKKFVPFLYADVIDFCDFQRNAKRHIFWNLLYRILARNSNINHTCPYKLSDVEQGGATAFPFLKIAVKPAKGNVLFWYNLHRSLDEDFRTKHAGCPVLKGSKWIGNVWTHERKQDVIRPCGLVRDHKSSLEYAIVK